MSTFTKLLAVTLISAAAASAQAAATLIDFEGVALAGSQTAVGNNYLENGFQLRNGLNPNQAAIMGSGAQNLTGTAYYTWDSPAANQVFLTNVNGFNFSLASLDVGSKDGFAAMPADFDIIGNFAAGGSVTYNVRGVSAFSFVDLIGFDNLSSVQFKFISGDYGAIDNLSIDALDGTVPEPGSLALLGLGLFGLLGAYRRKN